MEFEIDEDGVLGHLHPSSEKILVDETHNFAYYERKLCRFSPDADQENPFEEETACGGRCAFSSYCNSSSSSKNGNSYCSPSCGNKDDLYGSWVEIPFKHLKPKPQELEPQTDLEKEIISQIL